LTPTQVAIAKPVIRILSRLNTWAYRLTNGRIGGTYLHGVPVLLLTVVGRKTGRRLTGPLTYLKDGDCVVVAASRAGMDAHPLWYHNLVANPDVEVQMGADVRPMRAQTADETQRAYYWPKLVTLNPDYGAYQARTERRIPVIVLSPR
jgi:deazaflavin-dependent oxidoreductase (nitroreductase family)